MPSKKPTKEDLKHIHPSLHALAVPIEAFIRHPDNPRVHNRRNLDAISGSLARYQQRKNVVANRTPDGYRLEAGHGVYERMLEAGSKWIAAALVEDDVPTELGYMLADNRTGDLSEEDPAKDAAILRLLMEEGEDVEQVGWDDADVRKLLEEHKPDGEGGSPDPPEPQVDRAAELQKKWGTAQGQVWEIPSKTVPGRCHRVMCGDCRKPEDVARLLDGQKVNVAFTSPPYASQRKYDEESGFKPIRPDDYVEWFEPVQSIVREHLANDGSWFVNIKEHCEDGQRHLYVKDLTIAHVRRWGWRFVDELYWARSAMPMQMKHAVRFKNEVEPVFHYASNPAIKFNPGHVMLTAMSLPDRHAKRSYTETGSGFQSGFGADCRDDAYPSNLLWISKDATGDTVHSATFPVALPTFFIKAYSDPCDIIFDPFMGSWTTGIATEREGRISYGMEISPKYLAVQLQRAKDAGLEPRLA